MSTSFFLKLSFVHALSFSEVHCEIAWSPISTFFLSECITTRVKSQKGHLQCSTNVCAVKKKSGNTIGPLTIV